MNAAALERLKDKNILVVGLGLQGGGRGLVEFLIKHGAKVTVTDQKTEEQLQPTIEKLKGLNVRYSLGAHTLNDFLKADIIFKGPSVKWDLPELAMAIDKGIPVEMETAFFVEHTPSKVIGITGTRGKSTTTSMVYEVLRTAGRPVYLAGNIPETSTISLLDQVTKDDMVVLELSSWQLSAFHRKRISPHIAVFTNMYPDHLNYYHTMDDYIYDKKAIYRYQKQDDHLVAHRSLEEIIAKDQIVSQIHYYDASECTVELPYLKGEHNKENAAAALKVASLVGLNTIQAAGALQHFQGLPYRQQIVRQDGDIVFVNDSTSTTPVATIKALSAFSDKPIVLILGGNDKGLPMDDLLAALQNVQAVVLLKGSFTDILLPRLNHPDVSPVFDDLSQAVTYAVEKARVIGKANLILSPAATSFAMFKNEFHRAEEFNRIVSQLNRT